MKDQNGGNSPLGTILVIFFVAIFILFAVLTYSSPKRDVVHDPDGYLGYSDSFWEWQMKQ